MDLSCIPILKVKEVRQRANQHGRLKIDKSLKKLITSYRNKLKFTSRKTYNEIQTYTGTVDPFTSSRSGYGFQVWHDGSIYEGFWHLNLAHGYGRFISATGDVYVGDW